MVQTKLVNPLSEKEAARTRFSRVLRPTPIMRVRVTDPQPQQDARGSAYMTFAVDSCNRFVPMNIGISMCRISISAAPFIICAACSTAAAVSSFIGRSGSR